MAGFDVDEDWRSIDSAAASQEGTPPNAGAGSIPVADAAGSEGVSAAAVKQDAAASLAQDAGDTTGARGRDPSSD